MNGSLREFHPNAISDWYDATSVIEAFNGWLGTNPLRYYSDSSDGQYDFIVAITPGERDRLMRERAWDVDIPHPVAPTNGSAPLESGVQRELPGGPTGLARTLAFQQEYWPLPGAPGLGVASQAFLFLALAVGAEFVAWREDKKRWLDLLIMVGLGTLFTAFESSRGVILPDTRLLTIPAFYLGVRSFRRYRTRFAAMCGVFAAAFWAPFLGGDVLSAVVHYDTIRALSASEGSIFVIGGAGWLDGLVVVPVLAVVPIGFRLLRTLRRATRPTGSVPPPTLSVTATRAGSTLSLVVQNGRRRRARGLVLRLRDEPLGSPWFTIPLEVEIGGGEARTLGVAIPEPLRDAARLHGELESKATRVAFAVAATPDATPAPIGAISSVVSPSPRP